MLISVENASFSYGGNLILRGVGVTLHEGERVGLVGANGEGKTTLLKLMLGELCPDSGAVTAKSGIRVGYLEQNGGYDSAGTVYDDMRGVLSDSFAAVEKLEKLSKQLASVAVDTAEYARLCARIEGLNGYISAHDCYNADVRIKTVLNGMGFADRYGQKIGAMSGGEKTRLKLARLLLEEPDLLVLDEPTNHLDVRTLFWLEEYLAAFKGAVLVVSHDRFFLDRLCTRILEIENKGLLSFTGNYSKYKMLKAERNARLLKEYEAQREERARLQEYVDKNIVRATTAKSAQSRVKQLEKMQPMEKPFTPPAPPAYAFGYDNPPYEDVLTLKDLNLEIGGKRLICGGQLLVKRGDRVALVGENGTGKTTLLKAVLRGGNPAITMGRHVKAAYYDQENADLNGGNTVLQELWERHTGLTQTEVRALLARGGLFGEDMQKKVCELSGGERAKLALCVLESSRGNLLLLDEPTNHLDLPARESLERALQSFDGTLIFVSHDRYFLSALARRVVELEDGVLKVYEGDYGAYAAEKKRRAEEEQLAAESRRSAARGGQAGYRSKRERAEEVRLKAAVRETEADISAAEREEKELTARLSDPAVAADYAKLAPVLEELEAVRKKLDALYERYGELIG